MFSVSECKKNKQNSVFLLYTSWFIYFTAAYWFSTILKWQPYCYSIFHLFCIIHYIETGALKYWINSVFRVDYRYFLYVNQVAILISWWLLCMVVDLWPVIQPHLLPWWHTSPESMVELRICACFALNIIIIVQSELIIQTLSQTVARGISANSSR